MDWDELRVLLLLLRSRNAKDAAARLGVDRTTVGRQIAALEGKLGAQLFVRTRDGLRPTAAAERLRAPAERMEREAAAILQLARAEEGQAKGVVRVATTEALAAFLVSQGLLDVRVSDPELSIELLGGNRPVDLGRGEADLALRMVPSKEATLKVRCIARLAIGLFASPAYLRARGTPNGPAALRGHDVLLPSHELASLPEAKWLAARKGVRVMFQSSSMPALLEAAAQGVGIGAFTLAWGDRDPRLERVMVVDDIPRRGIWLVAPAAGAARPEVRVVGRKITAILSALGGRP